MGKTIFEQMGGTYKQQGDYYIPCLALHDKVQVDIGIWGQRHLRYIKQHHKVRYINLMTSGKLNGYLADIDKQAQERFDRLVEDMKSAQDIKEQLKAENALLWVGRLNNIRECAMEIVNEEIIYA